MSTGTVTSKGQITIPKSIRDELGLEPGARVSFLMNAEGFYELHRERRPVKALAGSLRYSGPPLSLEDMDNAIASGAKDTMR
ncbi:MAG: AbrB/MazE/SpoVT family DNA-binding domain-containing protein [Micropruina sp.]|uniref:AbrB/MazE/SpoVT family DNA-binding domain-containing protein n=1 Tax=Micropruina sp. TaxID=2737536 RepID=UPI0039E48D5C